jgi:hypothetical protein
MAKIQPFRKLPDEDKLEKLISKKNETKIVPRKNIGRIKPLGYPALITLPAKRKAERFA